MQRFCGQAFCAVLIMALAGPPAAAQDIYNSAASNNNESFNAVHRSNPTGTQGVTGNPNCPPPIINGITPKNWSCKTGTQGVQGNANCPPPVIIINGQPTTPRNWSCPGGTPAARNAPHAPWNPEHPGFPSVAGSTPCQPGGPGGYNWLNNPEGTRLPAGCVRPTSRTIAKSDPNYQTAPPGSYIVPPEGPPGSYIRPEGRPGSYIVPPHGAPGSYLNTTKNGTQIHTGPGGAIVLTPGNTESAEEEPARQKTQAKRGGGNGASHGPGNAIPYRQDTEAMRSGMVSNDSAPSYRVDTQAMRAGVIGNGATARKSTRAKNNDAAAANAQAAKIMSDFIRMGTEP